MPGWPKRAIADRIDPASIPQTPDKLQDLTAKDTPEQRLDLFLPVPVQAVRALGLLPLEIPAPLFDLALTPKATETAEIEARAEAFDGPWRSLAAQVRALLPQVERARQLLDESGALAAWRPQGSDAPLVGRGEQLDGWLRAESERRLLDAYRVVAETLTGFAGETTSALAPLTDLHQRLRAEKLRTAPAPGGASVAGLAEQIAHLRDHAGRLHADLIADVGRGEGAVELRALAPGDVAVFDAVSPLLGLVEKDQHLGAAIAGAVRDRQIVTLPGCSIGAAGWTATLRGRLDRLAALRPLTEMTDGPARLWFKLALGRKADADLDQLIADKTAERDKVLDEVMAEYRRNILEPLAGQLAELIVAMTPARWSYHEIKAELSLPSFSQNLEITYNNISRGDLFLNTAELNLFTISLFLLFAPRQEDNPWKILVLDDPLQNMDELTVTTLARTLARIARLLGPNWRLLLLFHGVDDFIRMTAEIPATTLQLPWQSKSVTSPDLASPNRNHPDPNRFTPATRRPQEWASWVKLTI